MSSQGEAFDGLLDALPDALIGIDESGLIRLVNRQAELIFGYGRDELLGAAPEMLLPESFRESYVGYREGYDASPAPRPMAGNVRVSAKRRDGTEFPADIALSSLETGEGRLAIAAVRDMTDQNGLGAQRRRADRLLAIVEHSDDAIIGVSPEGIVTSFNAGAERMYGYSAGEVVGRPLSLFSPQGRADEVSAILARVSSGESIDHLDTERVRKDGTLFEVSVSITPVRDNAGAIVGASTIARDVSEAKQAFEAARTMIEASRDSLVAISPDGRITDVNEATLELTGRSREELLGTSFSDYFTDPEQADEVYRRALADEAVADLQLTLRHHNGRETITEVLYNASAYRDPGGKVLGIFAAARDVTDVHKAAQYARSLIEATPEAMVAISPDGRITDLNEATVELTGTSRQVLLGTSFSAYFTDPERAEAGYRRAFEEGRVSDYPLTMRQTNDHVIELEVLYNASVYRDINGAALGVVATARDVTHQVQSQRTLAEQQAEEKERLEQLEKFQRLTVGRELKMIELKKEIEYLRKNGADERLESDRDW